MSIKEMIQDHPSVGSDYNDELGEAVKHAMYAAAICNSCVDACNAEQGDMSECIRKCSDASDICQAVSTVAARRTHGNTVVIKSLLEACIIACKVCAEESAKHDNPHCNRCERMCREVVEDCTKALQGMVEHARS
ncbi:four-helix bundle copper-binding protein [Aurantiacibacter aquimixticola]|uniref:Four-helix bundle copper-binding protein n=1 Tax=Aurantiacibacter aquimixticola TaxID=1958945 RepID=A0A419RR00_9SPHN|nr:four-helix bundle copper-binding protein [Aurantiacibacter aquimixticola]RJY08194.1 four-helix bundle copper-binding protein [Aurantiacibacter aquimixticola]